MKKFIYLAICATLLTACNEKPGYKITGTVPNADVNGKYIYMYEYGARNAAPLDSALIEKGSFTFKGEQNTPVLRVLRFSEKVFDMKNMIYGGFTPYSPWFVLDNSKLTIRVDENSTINGSQENDELTAYMQQLDGLFDNQTALEDKFNSKDEALMEEAGTEYEQLQEKANVIHEAYIKQHINNLSGAVVLLSNQYTLPENNQRELLNEAGDIFKSVPYVNQMIERLQALEKVSVGKTFTDFEMADIKGQKHKLSEYAGKGKVVLVDFWASWCGPCRKDMPHLVELYKQYKDKNFEIVGISLDSDAAAWEKGIKDLNITWPQLSDLKGWQNEGAATYGVNSIPHTILIDKDGIIIDKKLHGKKLDEKLAEIIK